MTALFLRSVNQDFTSHGGFQWPREVGAIVEATNWDPTPECGNGLHGLMWGEGKASLLGDGDDPHLVVEADAATAVDLGGQHKFPSCTVRLVGTRDEAVAYLIANGAADKAVVYARKTGGYGATLTGGDGATLTGGDWATLTGGDGATMPGG